LAQAPRDGEIMNVPFFGSWRQWDSRRRDKGIAVAASADNHSQYP